MAPKSNANNQTSQTNQTTTKQDAVALLKADHRKVESLFSQYENADATDEKQKLARQVCKELIIHTIIEEEIFYPACREKNVEHEMLDEAQVEHDGAKTMITELIFGSPSDEFFDAKVSVLSEYIKHHVGEEEKPRTGIFALAQKAGVDMSALGQKLQTRKQQLMAAIDENRLEPPQPRSLHPAQYNRNQEDYRMPRQSNYRDRDEYGRFTDDDDDRRGGYASRGNYRERDDEGRFMSENGGRSRERNYDDDERRGSYSSRGRDRDEYGRFTSEDDNGYRGSRSGGGRGWSGDPEGHSEASRRGWEGRGQSRDSYSSRGNDYDEDHRGSRGGSRGHGGWYGDPEGHSEAAERGWEGRGHSRGGHSARNRDYDEDDRHSARGGRGHGGWFGDPRGHSEAARRGWDDR